MGDPKSAFADLSRHGFANSVKCSIPISSSSVWRQSPSVPPGAVYTTCVTCQNQRRSELLVPAFQSTIPTAGPSDRYSCKKEKICFHAFYHLETRLERIALVTTQLVINAKHTPKQVGEPLQYRPSMQNNLFEHSVNSQSSVFSVRSHVADVGLSCQQKL